jgi:hypothetical protein
MQLRAHPLLSPLGLGSWPPIWVPATSGAQSKRNLLGEVGLLKDVRYYASRRGRLFLYVEHEGDHYVGCLMFDDPLFCVGLCERLERLRGISIEAIGGLELPAAFFDDAS